MAKFKRNLAVIIGINHYSKGIHPLGTAKHDAEKLAQILSDKNRQNPYEIIKITDDTDIKPNHDNLLNLLETTLPKLNLTKSDLLK